MSLKSCGFLTIDSSVITAPHVLELEAADAIRTTASFLAFIRGVSQDVSIVIQSEVTTFLSDLVGKAEFIETLADVSHRILLLLLSA